MASGTPFGPAEIGDQILDDQKIKEEALKIKEDLAKNNNAKVKEDTKQDES